MPNAESCAGFLELTARDDDPSVPSGSPPSSRRANLRRVKAAPHKQPGDERVGVPHFAGAQFVAAPDGRRHSRYQFEQPSRTFGVTTASAGPFLVAAMGFAALLMAAGLLTLRSGVFARWVGIVALLANEAGT